MKESIFWVTCLILACFISLTGDFADGAPFFAMSFYFSYKIGSKK